MRSRGTVTVRVMDAAVSAIVALLVAGITSAGAMKLQRDRLREEFRTQFMAEAALRELLLHKGWQLRTFDSLRKHIGGFEDDSLRQLLVRAGAVRFEGPNGQELWGLRERNADRLG